MNNADDGEMTNGAMMPNEQAGGHVKKQNSPSDDWCAIVAMGASAGGLDAYARFFEVMPLDSGIAFVLLQHPDPEQEELLPAMLSKHTRMPAQSITGDIRVEADTIYVVPSDAVITIEDCILKVRRTKDRSGVMPIDAFFRSLAEDQGDHVVCIILSGSGTDGTLGLKAVKEEGGMVMSQSIGSAKFQGMPESAIATGLVDYILPVEEMPRKLIEYVGHLKTLHENKRVETIREEASANLTRICALLRRKTGHDFSRYKKSTVIRRIQRRMQVLHTESVATYVERLRQEPKEVENLFKDLLIGVTHFFRDADAFEVLTERVFPKIFADKGNDEFVRFWVPGCATGEEAYSLAILVSEYLSRADAHPHIQIFATDIDNHALEVARQGRYPESIAEHVSIERLERYFSNQGNRYQVTREIRDMCIFSTHNLIKDPPFSRLDLISCRNLLIYLEGDLQKKLAPLFHQALRPGGFLFLGPSESMGAHAELFKTIEKKHRIFQRKHAVIRPSVTLPLAESSWFSRQNIAWQGQSAFGREQQIAKTFERILIESYAPAGVIINEKSEIVYFSGRTGKYLELPAGAPNFHITSMARKGLRLDLRTAIHKAISTRQPVIQENVMVETHGEIQRLNIIVRPLADAGEEAGLLMVVFQELGPAKTREKAEEDDDLEKEHPAVAQLENELRATKEYLQTTVEELETSNEELKSSNEELLSMNEELQSANEELQTSKEELQSVNQEIQTVNIELKQKIQELDRANSDLQNLFQSTRIATIFLDGHFRIKKFTASATDVFRLIDSDIGRPITDIAPRFSNGDIIPEIHEVLRTLAPKERQVRLADGASWFIMRILPYRTVTNVIDGVVITFVDITQLKQAESQLAQLGGIVESSHDAIIGKTLDGVITSWNSGAARLYGYSAQEVVGRPITIIIPPDHVPELTLLLDRVKQGERIEPFETLRVRKDGALLHVSLLFSPIHDINGQIIGVSAIARDISDQKRAEEEIRRSEERYRFITEALPQVVWISDANGKLVECNSYWYELTGLTEEEMKHGDGTRLSVHPDDLYHITEDVRQQRDAGLPYHFEYRVRRASDGAYRWYLGHAMPIRDDSGAVSRWLGTAFDIDDQKRVQERLRQSEERYRAVGDSFNFGVWMADPEGSWQFASRSFLDLVGGTAEDVLGFGWMNYLSPECIDPTRQRWEECCRNGEDWDWEHRFHGSDGAWYTVLSRARAIRDFEGTIIGWVGVNFDITDRKQAEAALRASEEEFRTMFELAGSAKVQIDPVTNHFVRANRKFLGMIGYSAEELVTMTLDVITHPEDRDRDMEGIVGLIAGEHQEYAAESRYIRKDGSMVWGYFTATLIRSDDGKPLRVIAVIQDTTERKLAQLELQRATREAEAANAAKDQFLAVLSHELRTPLTPVLASVEVLREELLPEEIRPFIDVIHRNIELEARLIDDLLDLTRIIKGKLRLNVEMVDVHALVQNVLDICRADISSKRLLLVVDLHAAAHHVKGDSARLQQVFWNLVQHAVKFTPEGGTVTLSSRDAGEMVVVEIVDTGIGIEPDILPIIFNAFEQGEQSVTRRFGGLGLGLAISKSIVDMHDGAIEAQSGGRGAGAAFTVTLPTADATQSIGTREEPEHAGVRILVVDDHKDTASVLRLLLEQRRYQVYTAYSADAALDAVERHTFDLVISDVNLSDGNGLELFRWLQNRGDIKGIAVSGFGMQEDDERSLAAGFSAHLAKPFSARKLYEVIDRILGNGVSDRGMEPG